MTEAILFVERYQAWMYLLLALAGLIYGRQAYLWLHRRRSTIFKLERDRATARLQSALALVGGVMVLIVGVYAVSNFAAPAVPASTRPTPLPTLSLLPTVTPEVNATGEAVTATPLPPVTVDGAGCENPQATLTSPAAGETVSGIVEVSGTADIPDFAFYKLEYISLVPGAVWRAIWAGTTPVVDDVLGTWDTSLVIPGDYAFRLVVTDAAGNAPSPCTIQLRIQAAP